MRLGAPRLSAARLRSGRTKAQEATEPSTRVGIVLVQFAAALENIPEARKDRLVGAARRFANSLPIAVASLARETANEARGENAAGQIALGRVS